MWCFASRMLLDQGTCCTSWPIHHPQNPASIDDWNKMRRGADAVNSIEVIELRSQMNQFVLHGFLTLPFVLVPKG